MAGVSYHPSVLLHHQIQSVLRSRIEAGEWGVGQRIPTEMELVGRFQVSRATIREALNSLERDGLIARRRRHGTFVKAAAARQRRAAVNNLVFGYQAHVHVVEVETVPAPAHVIGFLGVEPGQPIRRFVRVESLRDEPIAVVVNYMRLDLGRRVRPAHLARASMLEILQRRLGIRLGRVRQLIEARTPDDEVAALLGVDLTQPILAIRTLVPDRRGRPIEIADTFYRGDRYRYETTTAPPSRRALRARLASEKGIRSAAGAPVGGAG